MNARRWRLVRTFFLALVAGVLAFSYIGYRTARAILRDIDHSLPDLSWVQRHRPGKITTVYSREGKIIATLSEQRRKVVGLAQVSPHVLRALIATEDSRFYSHHGVDFYGIGRAALGNLKGGHSQGASTITMQLVRHYFLNQEQSYWRKIQEALLAQRLEKTMSKDEILIRYLNEVYFGAGAYGIQSAAATYFGKSAKNLSPVESALIVGLLQSPSGLSPYSNPKGAHQRTLEVLDRMESLGYLTGAEKAEAVGRYDKLAPKRPMQASNVIKYPYFTNYALSLVAKQIPHNLLYEGGLSIRTTMDLRAQRLLEQEVTSTLNSSGSGYGADSAAVVLIDNASGEIRAMVGGRQYSAKDRFNRAWQSRLQAGSSFKPFLYATALSKGMDPESRFSDDPVKVAYDDSSGTQRTWEPANFDHQSKGQIPMREALKLSRNTVAARLICYTGIDPVLQMAHRLGIQSELPQVPSVALGVGEVSPLEMATAYSTIARGGLFVPATCLRSVQTPQGDTFRLPHAWRDQVLTPEQDAQLVEMMMRVVEEGTGGGARLNGVQVAGKTGTTDKYRDAWFIGFTPRYTMAVWMGNSNHKPTYGMTGGSLPATLFARVMGQLEASTPTPTFAGLRAQPQKFKLCKISHQLATTGCEKTYQERFWRTAPTQTCEECEARPKLVLTSLDEPQYVLDEAPDTAPPVDPVTSEPSEDFEQ
ncbi:MAG: PBP1A family penicillin-binding protein [Candidatus Eremiobacteraeota bacterium]|nr:PBP1A family penicillin-binding protein [Candidatus Eremiobacteraeota bacterium]